MAHHHATVPSREDASFESDPESSGEDGSAVDGPPDVMAEPPDDATIIAAVRAGQVDRYRELVERYQGKLIATLQQLVGARAQAEELAHQSFVDAYRSLRRFDASRPFPAWLYRIAINNAKDWLKSHKRRESSLPDGMPDAAAVFAGALPDPRRVAAAREELLRLRGALERLPYELREALILHSVQGMSYQEMHEILGVAVTALKNRVVRGRARLKELLGERDD